MRFSVYCYLPIIFSVCCKLANFLMFTVSEENTVKCSEGSSDIFGNGRIASFLQSSGIVGSLRKSSCYKAEN